MIRRLIAAAVLCTATAACTTRTATPVTTPAPSGAGAVDAGYTAYFSGSAVDAVTVPAGGALLAGGGTDSDAAMTWLLAQGGARAPKRYGDVVVLRTSGSNGYNKYLMSLGANSVTSIVIRSPDGANSAYVRDAIAKAEVVFLAGGDQSTYVQRWSGTGLQAGVNARVAAGFPIGGTSAGLAAMSEYVYSALNVSSVSATVLQNPYDSSMTFSRSLFSVPLLRNTITDTHFAPRDRFGRSVAFLARLQQDGLATAPRGIAVDEGSSVGVAASGDGVVFGSAGSGGAWFMQSSATATRICAPSTPLSFAPVTVWHVPVGGRFDLAGWSTHDATPYTVTAVKGVLTSSTGSIY
ncbi:MAG: cyanophycinase [Gemmatimonadaceae bacterium]|nr:cyanophycinase [Gemmatimonadaceae bacterium]